MWKEARAYQTCPDVFSSESLAGLSDGEREDDDIQKRRSMGASSGATMSTGLGENLSLPNSTAGSSVLDPGSAPSTPNFASGALDLEDDELFVDGLVGLP